MDLHTRVGQWLSDDRLLANLIGLHLVLAIVLVVSVLVRKVLIHGGDQLVRWTGLHWLDGISKEAVRRIRSFLFWSTLSAMSLLVITAALYHMSGRDVRTDLSDWYHHLTAAQLVRIGLAIGQLALVVVGTVFAFRLVRRLRVGLEKYALNHLAQTTANASEASGTRAEHACLPGAAGTQGKQEPLPHVLDAVPASGPAAAGPVNYIFGGVSAAPSAVPAAAPPTPATPPAPAAALDVPPESAKHVDHEHTVKRWFHLFERFALCTVFLFAMWIAGHVVYLGEVTERVIGFVIRLLAIIMVARLLTLAARTISHALSALGERHLGEGKFQRYWERVTRLFPFGERCFEAAVYISAASLCVHELEFIAVIADFGPRLVQCIGIFFVTRVLIELFTVLLNEAFSMYEEERPLDQKGQTLVPLLQSIGQYVLYFGSGVIMLGVLGVDTRPILAGAGILGLAGGLGAQSLVTDVVSGFFILFENQYLVGDVVKIGDAEGRVEAVSIRHTQIRDDQGKLHIIPNGQVKCVINYSKGYVNAVVDFKAPSALSLEEVTSSLSEAGRRLRKSRREALSDTLIKGVIELTPSDMTLRCVTRVTPGSHQAMQNEFRRLLKEVLDEKRAKAAAAAA